MTHHCLGLSAGTSRRPRAVTLSAQAHRQPPKRTEKHPQKCSVPRGSIHGTTCYYVVQYPSKRTALAVFDSETDTLLVLYLKEKNTGKHVVIGVVSQQLAWREKVQAKS